ncbi:GXGXG motif-containing protein [Phytophthora infestans]|uniref:GXGXG motif-containing protein n=1 Tax=Phytophthora infestans TaxID=4787 RepID=A0A833S9K3_PHYIN|nr:GXGXG motif-containing protein [Phytophthora infestans]
MLRRCMTTVRALEEEDGELGSVTIRPRTLWRCNVLLARTRVKPMLSTLEETNELCKRVKLRGRFYFKFVDEDKMPNIEEMESYLAGYYQGVKPGEGGELPAYKVSDYIGSMRHTTPGVGLISPPPHHDIYSIEDRAQLIQPLKRSNPSAEVSVKLVSEVGVGVVALGVAKAKSDHITVAALLGAEEFGFATGQLIALSCIMMLRACDQLHVMLAEEVQDYMRCLGFRKLDDLIGRADRLKARVVIEDVATNLDRSLGATLSHEVCKRYDEEGLLPTSSSRATVDRVWASVWQSESVLAWWETRATTWIRLCPAAKCRSTRRRNSRSVQPGIRDHGQRCAVQSYAYFSDKTEKRFCVRSSGVKAVVEIVGDHGCEYMTGGRVAVLGSTGRNFAAGMSHRVHFRQGPDFPGEVQHGNGGLQVVDGYGVGC